MYSWKQLVGVLAISFFLEINERGRNSDLYHHFQCGDIDKALLQRFMEFIHTSWARIDGYITKGESADGVNLEDGLGSSIDF